MNKLALWGVLIIGVLILLAHLAILFTVVSVGSGEFRLEDIVQSNTDGKFEREVQEGFEKTKDTDAPLGPGVEHRCVMGKLSPLLTTIYGFISSLLMICGTVFLAKIFIMRNKDE